MSIQLINQLTRKIEEYKILVDERRTLENEELNWGVSTRPERLSLHYRLKWLEEDIDVLSTQLKHDGTWNDYFEKEIKDLERIGEYSND